jgi:hypothetical protein
MSKHSSELIWVAAVISFFLLIAFIAKPVVERVTDSQSTRLETVTNGDTITPPPAWQP